MFGNQPTDTQQRILNAARRNPDMTNAQIANHCDCSTSYVSQTLNEFGDPRNSFDIGL